MMPGLGKKYSVDIETISKPKEQYMDEYYESDVPIVVAPAIVVDGELAIQGGDITQERLEAIVCRHLGIDTPNAKKGLLGNIFGGLAGCKEAPK